MRSGPANATLHPCALHCTRAPASILLCSGAAHNALDTDRLVRCNFSHALQGAKSRLTDLKLQSRAKGNSEPKDVLNSVVELQPSLSVVDSSAML